MKILDFKQNPFKMKINPMTGDTRTGGGGGTGSGRSCFRARFVFRWKTWVVNLRPLKEIPKIYTIKKNP